MLFGCKYACDLSFKDVVTGEVLYYIDGANNFSWTIESDQVTANRAGNEAITWITGTTGTGSVDFEVVDMKMIGLFSGAEVVEGANYVPVREDDHYVTSGTITLKETPNAQIVSIYELESDKTHGERVKVIESGDTTTTGKRAVISGKTITFTDVSDGTRVVVYYATDYDKVRTLKIKGNQEAKVYAVDGFGKIKYSGTKQEAPMYFEFPRFQPNVGAGMELGADSASTFTFEFTILPDPDENRVILKEVLVKDAG